MELCRCCYHKTPVESSKNILIDRYDNLKLLDIITKIVDAEIYEDDPFPKEICYHCYQILIFICDFMKLVRRTDRKFHQNVNDKSNDIETTTNQHENETNNDAGNVEQIVSEVDVFHDNLEDEYVDEQENFEQTNVHIDNGSMDNSGIVENSNVNIKIETHENSSVKPKKEQICHICDKKLSSNSNLRRHLRIHEKPFKCSKCEKRFSDENNLEIHLKSHNDNSEFWCNICNKSLAHAESLKRHLLIHKKFKCNACNKTFHRRDDLKRHSTIHSVQTTFCCKICHKTFGIRSNLKKHLSIHNKDGLFACHICGKVFRRKYGLNRHLLSKVVHMKKIFSCHICREKFDSTESLQKHVTPQIDADPLICKICNKNFVGKCSLNQHMSSQHGN